MRSLANPWRWTVLAFCVLAASVWAAVEDNTDGKEADDHVMVEGIAVNHFGGGIADVNVTIRQGEKLLGEGVTGATGEFAIPISKEIRAKIMIKMSKPGFTDFEIEEEFDPVDPPYVDTELKGATTFKGTVVHHEKETPIAGAKVKMESAGRTWKATSDEKGEFVVKELVPGRVTMTVAAEGFGRELKSLELGELAQRVIVALRPGRVIRLHVVDDKGKDVPKATVHLQTMVENQPDLQMKATDENGIVEFRNVNYDTREARAKLFHPDHVQDQGFLREIEISESSKPTKAEFVLTRAAKIVGVVTDANTGNPVHSVRVIAGVPGEGYVPVSFTDAKGRYELTGIDGGTYPITMHRTDYAPSLTKVTVARGETKTLDLSIDKGRPLGGVVVDDSGQPLREFYLISKSWLGFDTLGFKTITDENGHFEFDNAPVGEIVFQIETPDLEQKSAEDAMLRAGRTNYRIEVKSLIPLQPIPAAPVAKIKPGDPTPNVKMTSLEGTELSLEALRGSFVFLDFWATWCGPCVQELPNLQALYKATKGRNDFVIISVSADESERTLKKFLSAHSMPWHHVFGHDKGVPEVSQAFDVNVLPCTFLIDKRGKILDTNLRGGTLVDSVLEYIAKEPASQKKTGLK